MESTDRIRQNETVRSLLKTLDEHSPGEKAHGERVATYAVATGEKMGLSDEELLSLRYAATLHDVGKVRVDANLLGKLGTLTPGELGALRLHAELALSVLDDYDFLQKTVPMVRSHHEHWNGGGYPEGLKEEEIPLGARLIAVAEAFDMLLAGSPWREAFEEETAIAEIQSCAGTQFDPKVVEAFLRVQPLIQPVHLN